MAIYNPGDEYTLDEIFENLRKLIEAKRPTLVDNRGLNDWYNYLGDRIKKKLGRTKVG